MHLEYKEIDEVRLNHILVHFRSRIDEDKELFNTINKWASEQFGAMNEQWNYQRGYEYIPDLVPDFITRYYQVWHSWQFLNKSDAMLFKIRWHN